MRVLIIDDEEEVLENVKNLLLLEDDIKGNPYEVKTVTSHVEGNNLLGSLKENRFEIVIVDMYVGKGEESVEKGLENVRQLTKKSPVTIVFTGTPSISNCVTAMKDGAFSYVHKYPDNDPEKGFKNLLKEIEEGCDKRIHQPNLGVPDPSYEWVQSNLERLKKDYPGEIIAVLDGEVLASGTSLKEVLGRITEQGSEIASPYLFSVPKST